MNQPKSMFRGAILRSIFFASIVGVSVGGAHAAQEQPFPADIRDTLAESLQRDRWLLLSLDRLPTQ
jgi:hypothetical protein